MKTLSIIILTYNSEKDIYSCLDSVYQHNDIGEALEVIVVDNQSNEFAAMQQEIAKRYPEVIITQNTHNGGYGQGNNVGIRMAHTPIIAMTANAFEEEKKKVLSCGMNGHVPKPIDINILFKTIEGIMR
jgi:GT2 family glycosyltransferase